MVSSNIIPSIGLLILLLSVALGWQWEESGGMAPFKLAMRRYIAGETPILPGSLGRRDDQHDEMMNGNGMGQRGRAKSPTDEDEEENADVEDHIGESPNSVEAAAKRADKERNGRRQEKGGGVRARRAHLRQQQREEFLEEIFE